MLVTDMTSSTPTAYLRPEFDSFLYAEIGKEKDGRSISVLSALARQNVDPWQEAAKFDLLQIEPASQRLVDLIATLQGGAVAGQEAMATADRLISLLPHMGRPGTNGAGLALATPTPGAKGFASVLIFTYAVLMIMYLFGRHFS